MTCPGNIQGCSGQRALFSSVEPCGHVDAVQKRIRYDHVSMGVNLPAKIGGGFVAGQHGLRARLATLVPTCEAAFANEITRWGHVTDQDARWIANQYLGAEVRRTFGNTRTAYNVGVAISHVTTANGDRWRVAVQLDPGRGQAAFGTVLPGNYARVAEALSVARSCVQ